MLRYLLLEIVVTLNTVQGFSRLFLCSEEKFEVAMFQTPKL